MDKKDRLKELTEKHEKKHGPFINPITYAKEKSEIKKLKKEIREYEEKKKEKIAMIVIPCIILAFAVVITIGTITDNKNKTNEIAIESEIVIPLEMAQTCFSETENGKISTTSNESCETTTENITKTQIQTSEIADESDNLSNDIDNELDNIIEIKASDLGVYRSTDYSHIDSDVIHLGNNESVTISISVPEKTATWDDLIVLYEESMLNVKKSEPEKKDNKLLLSLYVTAKQECNTEIDILTVYDYITLGDKAKAFYIIINKLDDYNGHVVYTTPTGTKYHFSYDCAGDSATKTTRYDAMMCEYEPCSKCT